MNIPVELFKMILSEIENGNTVKQTVGDRGHYHTTLPYSTARNAPSFGFHVGEGSGRLVVAVARSFCFYNGSVSASLAGFYSEETMSAKQAKTIWKAQYKAICKFEENEYQNKIAKSVSENKAAIQTYMNSNRKES